MGVKLVEEGGRGRLSIGPGDTDHLHLLCRPAKPIGCQEGIRVLSVGNL